MSPLITVIIPVYNCENYIKKCLDSLIKQTYQNIEVIVIDDGSFDNSLQTCLSYSLKDTRVKVYSKKNGGPGSARNYGLNKANGDFIAFIDSDDYVEDNYLEYLYNLLVKNNADVSSCGYDTILKNNLCVPCDGFEKEVFNINSANLKKIHYPYTVWHMMFSRSALSVKGDLIYFDEDIFYLEDLKFIDQVMMNCQLVISTSEVLYHRIARENSLTENRYQIKDFNKFYTSIYALQRMCKLTKNCSALYQQRSITLIKESLLMKEMIKKKKIQDRYKIIELESIIDDSYKEIKLLISLRTKIILFFIMHFTNIYCILKKIDFTVENNTIS